MELTLFVDHQCNLRCRYCYTGDKFTRRMSLDTMRRAVDLALATRPGRLGVSFFGGEPLLHPDFVRDTMAYVGEAVRALPHPRPPTRFFMNTNATLLDDAAVALMAPPHFSVYASLDGDRATHDENRVHASGRGSHDDALAGLARLRAAAIPFHLLAVVTPANARRAGATVRALAPLGAERVHLSPDLRADWTEDAVAELRLGLADATAHLKDLFRAGTPLGVEPFHAKILSHLKGGMPCPSRCQIGGAEWCVSPAGHIYPCAQMVGTDQDPTLRIGHVDHGLDVDARLRLQHQKDRVEETCAPCELRDRCQSHCGCRHLALTGQLGEITAALCELEGAFIDAADAFADELYREACPSFLGYYYERAWSATPGAELTQLRRARDAT